MSGHVEFYGGCIQSNIAFTEVGLLSYAVYRGSHTGAYLGEIEYRFGRLEYMLPNTNAWKTMDKRHECLAGAVEALWLHYVDSAEYQAELQVA